MSESDVIETLEFLRKPFPSELSPDLYSWVPNANVVFAIDGEYIGSNRFEERSLPVLEFAVRLQVLLQTISVGETKPLDLLLEGPVCKISMVDEQTLLLSAPRFRESGIVSINCDFANLTDVSTRFLRKVISEVVNKIPGYFERLTPKLAVIEIEAVQMELLRCNSSS